MENDLENNFVSGNKDERFLQARNLGLHIC